MTRTRYFSTAWLSAATGTLNCAAHAAVFVHSCEERIMRHVPPIGSLTSTRMGVGLWLRSVISGDELQRRVPERRAAAVGERPDERRP